MRREKTGRKRDWDTINLVLIFRHLYGLSATVISRRLKVNRSHAILIINRAARERQS